MHMKSDIWFRSLQFSKHNMSEKFSQPNEKNVFDKNA